MAPPRAQDRLGVDTGGTFTDLVLQERGQLRVTKVLSTPKAPEEAILEGLARLDPAAGTEVIHGSTVGLNALLTGTAARVALVTNRGFRDLIEIGRQDRPDLYALSPQRPRPLVAREDRWEVSSRVWPDRSGALERVVEASQDELRKLARAIRRSGAESVAVCLLHSYADPSDEQAVAHALRAEGLPVTCSGELLGLHREHERTSTAVVNAALVPVMSAYLSRLSMGLGGRRLSILQSSGGSLASGLAVEEPARVVLSGPAGGVVGAAWAAEEAGLSSIVTLDMGGTSTDVAFHERSSGLAGSTGQASVAGHPVALPALDVHTIGCGGGSLIALDRAGILQVGPRSAGADPGPIAFGRGEQLTLTDAFVHLGRVQDGPFLEGTLPLEHGRVEEAFHALGRSLGCTAREAALASLDVARASMRRAVAVRTLQRGHDPARSALVAFGGGGGLVAAELADALSMERVLVPAHAGVLSALGMVRAEMSLDRQRTILEPLQGWTLSRRRELFAELAQEIRETLGATGQALGRLRFERVLELRYEGQSHELSLCEGPRLEARFAELHERLFGWTPEDGVIELVHAGCRGYLPGPRPAEVSRPRRRRAPAKAELAPARGDRPRALDAGALEPGHTLQGPVTLIGATGTTWVPAGWRCQVLTPGHHLLERA